MNEKEKETEDPRPQSSDVQIKASSLGPDRDQASNARLSKKLLVPRLMSSLFSLIALETGVMAVLTAHYYARSGQLGGTDISLEGWPAIVMGLSTIFLGLIPLALWVRTRRTRIVWAIACFVVATVAFFVSVSLQHT